MDTGSTGLGFYTRPHAAPDLLNFQLAIHLAAKISLAHSLGLQDTRSERSG
jgi:hypothetical protein